MKLIITDIENFNIPVEGVGRIFCNCKLGSAGKWTFL